MYGKIFIKWYGLGEDYINLGLPHYAHMDCNPDADYEIKDTCCGRRMVILKLKFVKVKTVYKAPKIRLHLMGISTMEQNYINN